MLQQLFLFQLGISLRKQTQSKDYLNKPIQEEKSNQNKQNEDTKEITKQTILRITPKS